MPSLGVRRSWTKSCIKLGCESVCGITFTITLNSVKQSILHLYFILDPMNFHEVTTSLRQLASSKEVQFERRRSIIDRLQIPQQEIVTLLASLGLYAEGPSKGLKIRGWQYYLVGIICPPCKSFLCKMHLSGCIDKRTPEDYMILKVSLKLTK